MSQTWTAGNAADDTADSRGWLVGHFIPASAGVRRSADVEVKWGIHPTGDKRAEWTADDQRTTVVVLIEGTFQVDLTGQIYSESIGTSTLFAAWNAAIYVGQIEDARREVVIRGTRYLEVTGEVLQKHGGLWFWDESYAISRRRD